MYKSWMWKQRSFREQFQGDEAGSTGGSAAGSDQAHDDQQQAEDETSGAEQQDEAQSQDDAAQAQQAGEDEEVVITIGDETPPAANDDEVNGKPAPQWLKDLRKADREKAKRIRELEQKLAGTSQQAPPAAPAVGEKPTLEGCDFDPERFETELTSWHERKRKADEVEAAARQEQEAAQAAWTQKLTAYKAAGAALKVSDFADAEAAAQEVFNPTQLGIIVNGADNPAHLVYALGRNPAKAKELAAIKDPVKYAFAVAKLETQLKVTPRKAPPAPERQVRGNAAGMTGVDNTLARLQAEADKTGDRSKVAAYLRQRKQAA
jgi:hypothetical protein